MIKDERGDYYEKVISLLVVLVISAVSLSACGKERTKLMKAKSTESK